MKLLYNCPPLKADKRTFVSPHNNNLPTLWYWAIQCQFYLMQFQDVLFFRQPVRMEGNWILFWSKLGKWHATAKLLSRNNVPVPLDTVTDLCDRRILSQLLSAKEVNPIISVDSMFCDPEYLGSSGSWHMELNCYAWEEWTDLLHLVGYSAEKSWHMDYAGIWIIITGYKKHDTVLWETGYRYWCIMVEAECSV